MVHAGLGKWVVFLAAVLAVSGGAAATAHQFFWIRRMLDFMGSGSGSVARVVGCVFLGYAVGAWLGGLLSARLRRPWRAIGWIELAIGVTAIPMVYLVGWTDGLWAELGIGGVTGWTGWFVKWGISLAALLPPTILMGAFLPLAIQGLEASWRGRAGAGLPMYAFNTSGAVLGPLAAVFLLLPALGIRGGLWALIAWNLTAACVAWVNDGLSQRVVPPLPDPVRSEQAGSGPLEHRWILVAGLSGALVLAAEVCAFQMLGLVAPLSVHSPAILLSCVILALAVAAAAVAWMRDGVNPWALATAGAAAAVAFTLTPPFFQWLARVFPLFFEGGSFAGFSVRLGILVVLTVGPAFLAAGVIFPMATRIASAGTGRAWGILLAANGIGGLIGAEVAYRFLLGQFGPFTAFGVLGMIYGLLALWLMPGIGNKIGEQIARAGIWCGLGVSVVASAWWLPRLPSVNPLLAPYVIDESHGREGSLAVIDSPKTGRALLFSNQYLLGSTSAAIQAERQAHLPLILHPGPKNVAFLGVATGITPGAALTHANIERITAIEISSEVTLAAAKWFGEFNQGIVEDERTEIIRSDARTVMAATPDAFDVIIGDLFLPWGAGEARLYSIEHFENVRRSLKDGGLFVQWFPMHQLTAEQFDLILDSFVSVFGATDVFKRDADRQHPAVALAAWKDADIDWDAIAGQMETGRQTPHSHSKFHSVAHLQNLHIARIQKSATLADLNSLDQPRLELDAGRLRVTRPESAPYLTFERFDSWIEKMRVQSSVPDAPAIP